MNGEKRSETFRVVGLKGKGNFAYFSTEVPRLAKQFMERVDELQAVTGPEVAVYEPKKDSDHVEGIYYVGVIVNEPLNSVPDGMTYIELDEEYALGKGQDIGTLHTDLMKWMDDQGYQRKTKAYIVETYHPLEDGGEEVVVYLPIEEA
ncbi:GyrI-like domain-containing protein [Rossellomorea vietnamensis]|uniref:GyrI-like domain-containing protein n=1 Tax=Rossellomorea vietnamensis TaxID=218284 RepID=UPI001E523BAE|nr:GyrI-like domain-containing protein [Rossellomorea vietnamensis]MCC5800833.1 GyrI-like domain-containing protein [Rossellomorea vietnamensis]